MKVLDVRGAARQAVAANPTRPATAIVHDSADARLIVFRLSPGQSVAPHRNASSVILTVISGSGLTSGADEERQVVAGDLVTYEPNEMHGMRAVDEELVLLATIAPRPGSRGS
ncbi:MAG TPA: cupin domain-containing protein [Gemmatimonadaceae bacterium]|nr:cupin domain-containing protein [Gemmatimonadaceae bacterium]